MRSPVVALVVVLSACSPWEPRRDCTAMGCGFDLKVRLERGRWPAGAYAFVLDLDGERVTCEMTLPLQNPETDTWHCSEQERVDRMITGNEIEGWVPEALVIRGEPRRLGLTVTHDGAALHEVVWRPEYAVSRPNGEGCEPVCRSAELAVLLLP